VNLIALMSGLQAEVKIVVGKMTGVEEIRALDRTIFAGELEGQKIVVVGTGVGKVRASAFAQFLIDQFGVDQMIIFGLAGALDTRLAIGDVIVSRTAVIYDYIVAGEGVSEDISIPPTRADDRLMELAVRAGRNVAGGSNVTLGVVLTGDAAIASAETRTALRDNFGGDCVEMEGGAAALVCSLNQTPFVIVRAISDLADEQAHRQFEKTFDEAARRSADVVLEMLRMLSQDESLVGRFRPDVSGLQEARLPG
jgi:adenosylhomocysteine nucleosidase